MQYIKHLLYKMLIHFITIIKQKTQQPNK